MKKTAIDFEAENVHKFYSDHSNIFSSTRYAPWPGISNFLKSIDPTSSLVLDSGCGNGRNMINGMFGVDFSMNLLVDAKNRFHNKSEDHIIANKESDNKNTNTFQNADFKLNEEKNVANISVNFARCNILCHPFKENTFDHILSIAVIHHLSTKKRRIEALMDLRKILKPNGTVLIYVWSRHVKNQSKFTKICLDNDVNESGNADNDYKVVWGKDEHKTRYYYLYDIDELKEDCISSGFTVDEIKIDQESICAILRK